MSTNDEARAEAERRYPDDYSHEGDRLGSRIEFIAGAEWQASRKIDRDELAEVLHASDCGCSDGLDESEDNAYHRHADAVIAYLAAAPVGGEVETAPELFSGTFVALDGLTIRREHRCEFYPHRDVMQCVCGNREVTP